MLSVVVGGSGDVVVVVIRCVSGPVLYQYPNVCTPPLRYNIMNHDEVFKSR